MALVQDREVDSMEYRQLYVIERTNKSVLVRMLAEKVKESWTLTLGSLEPDPVAIEAKDIMRVSEILMLTVRPAPPPLSAGKRGS